MRRALADDFTPFRFNSCNYLFRFVSIFKDCFICLTTFILEREVKRSRVSARATALSD